MMALTLSTPELDWFTPWLNIVTVLGVRANSSKNAVTSAWRRPQAIAVSATLPPTAMVSSKPSTFMTKARSVRPLRCR